MEEHPEHHSSSSDKSSTGNYSNSKPKPQTQCKKWFTIYVPRRDYSLVTFGIGNSNLNKVLDNMLVYSDLNCTLVPGFKQALRRGIGRTDGELFQLVNHLNLHFNSINGKSAAIKVTSLICTSTLTDSIKTVAIINGDSDLTYTGRIVTVQIQPGEKLNKLTFIGLPSNWLELQSCE